MGLGDLTYDSVVTAVEEFDELGRDAFLARYGFREARSYYLDLNDRLYDSKAIAGAAHGYARPDLGPLKHEQFSGGAATVEARFEELGFRVVRTDTTKWDVQPGTDADRTSLHDRYGGSRQSGISPSRITPNVLIFTNPAVGPEHGYYDSWQEDGTFHYAGEGQTGDQQFVRGNKALLEHTDSGRAVRLFESTDRSGVHRYVGELELDPADPFHIDRAPETGGGPIRDVIIFHLLPLDSVDRLAPDQLTLPERAEVSVSDIEAHNTEQYLARPHGETIEKERREQGLVHEYADWLRARGSTVIRYTYRVGGSRLACDAFDVTNNVLIEAKSTTDRNSIRLGIGQLYDYSRFHETPPQLRMLLPRHPGQDLADLLDRSGIELVYPLADGFAPEPPDGHLA